MSKATRRNDQRSGAGVQIPRSLAKRVQKIKTSTGLSYVRLIEALTDEPLSRLENGTAELVVIDGGVKLRARAA